MDRAEEKQLFSLIDAGTANSAAGDIAVLRASVALTTARGFTTRLVFR